MPVRTPTGPNPPLSTETDALQRLLQRAMAERDRVLTEHLEQLRAEVAASSTSAQLVSNAAEAAVAATRNAEQARASSKRSRTVSVGATSIAITVLTILFPISRWAEAKIEEAERHAQVLEQRSLEVARKADETASALAAEREARTALIDAVNSMRSDVDRLSGKIDAMIESRAPQGRKVQR